MASSIGSLQGAFGNVITFDWYPEPIVVANEIAGIAAMLDNMAAPLETAKGLAQQNIGEHFIEKRDPDGDAWADWSESYEQSGRGVELMIRTGATYAGAISDESYDVIVNPGGGEVVFTAAGVPGYGMIHQFGAEFRTNRYGAPSPLPRRAFAGVDTATQLAIIAEFDAWVGSVVDTFGSGGGASIGGKMYATTAFTHPSGRVQSRIGGWWGPNV